MGTAPSAAAASESSVAAAAAAASDMNHLLRPLHWTAVLRHPHAAAGSPLLFRLCTTVMIFFALCFICSEGAVLFHQGTEDVDVFILLLSTIDTATIWIFRMVHTAVFEQDFHKLALQVGDDFAEFLTWDDIPVIRSRCRMVRRFTLTFVWVSLSGCCYFLVSPASADGLPFILALPYDASTPSGYAVSWLFCAVVCLHAVVMTTVLDSFNVSLIAQLRIQLTLLSSKIVILAKEMSDVPAHSTEKSSYHDLHYRLKKCVLHHQAIIKNADLLERRLGAMLLAQSISIGAAACFQMFQIATSADGMQQMGKFGIYLSTMLSELFVYCWFGDDLITESENLAMAAYDAVTSLQGCPLSIKRSLLLLMHRPQRPLCITAGGFFPLSRESFVAVLNVSYSFFAILRNFKEEEQ
ncbi:odorant receptor Or2-like [Schistocerca gregaria]|uniref:odorant receptor Or2-like n=1 Tax=Schistocerca gregaria TaxID=7010 RepID=UPI00211E0E21|nr:odorant receptor Or2-like [Schistocerca gregaria]